MDFRLRCKGFHRVFGAKKHDENRCNRHAKSLQPTCEFAAGICEIRCNQYARIAATVRVVLSANGTISSPMIPLLSIDRIVPFKVPEVASEAGEGTAVHLQHIGRSLPTLLCNQAIYRRMISSGPPILIFRLVGRLAPSAHASWRHRDRGCGPSAQLRF